MESIKRIAKYYGSIQLVKLLEEVTELQISLLNIVSNAEDDKSVLFKNYAVVSENLKKELKEYIKTSAKNKTDFLNVLELKTEYDEYFNLFEEVADVYIMIEQFKLLFDPQRFVEEDISYKISRQLARINEQ